MKTWINGNTVSLTGYLTKNKALFFISAKILIAAGLVSYLIIKVNLNNIISSAAQANIYLISSSFLLSFLNIFIQYVKWKMVCNVVLNEYGEKKIFNSLFYGFSAGIFTPGRIGEYFGRGIVFNDKPLLKVIAATFIDKIFTLAAVLFLGVISGIFFLHFYYSFEIHFVTISILILMLVCYGLVKLFANKSFKNYLANKIKLSPKFSRLFYNVKIIKNINKKFAVKFSIVTILFYFCFIIQFALLAAAFSHNLNYIIYIWAGSLMMFVKSFLPVISIGEIGVRESAAIFFITEMGELSYVGFNASMFLFIINILIPSLYGLFLMFKKNK